MENQDVAGLHKMPTGVEGFDAITGGGLPRNRTSSSSAVPASSPLTITSQIHSGTRSFVVD